MGCRYNEMQKYDKMIEIYEGAIKLGCVKSMYNLGRHYYKIHDYNKMKKYYKMAIKKKCVDSFLDLSKFYFDNKKYKKYFSLILDMYRKDSKWIGFKYICRKFLRKIKNFIIKEILESDFAKNGECDICCNDKEIYKLCNHNTYLCINCYTIIENCPYCRKGF